MRNHHIAAAMREAITPSARIFVVEGDEDDVALPDVSVGSTVDGGNETPLLCPYAVPPPLF
jgi:hypothetical protein